jgi:hypothetical protein
VNGSVFHGRVLRRFGDEKGQAEKAAGEHERNKIFSKALRKFQFFYTLQEITRPLLLLTLFPIVVVTGFDLGVGGCEFCLSLQNLNE